MPEQQPGLADLSGTELRVAIIGAGMGGLSLALALRERGMVARVFEQASELTEIGATIALSANAIREFGRLGLADDLASMSTIPTELIYRHWRDGSRIAAHPVRNGDWYLERFGAPYFASTVPTQKTLSAALGAEHLHLGCRLVNIVEQPDSVVLEFANGRVEQADLVVGADGVRSTVHGGSPAPTTASTPGPAPSAGSSRPRICPRCRTRRRSSSGWGPTGISCTTRSGLTARRSTFSRSWPRPGSGWRRARSWASPTRCQSPRSGAGTRP
jgi:hypothetical protein